MDFKQIMDSVSRGFEVVAIGVLVLGCLTVEIDGMAPWRRWRLMAPGPPPPERRNDTG